MKDSITQRSPMRASTDTTRLGETTYHRGLRSPATDHVREPWCEGMSACPILSEMGIRHLGIVDACGGYHFIRREPKHTILLATLDGVGNAGSAPSVSLLPQGHGVVLPRNRPSAYFNVADQPWRLAWICFEHPCPVVVGVEASRFPVETKPLQHTMEALFCCWDRYHSRRTTFRLLEVLVDLVRLHLRVDPELERFHRAWQTVGADPAAPWTLGRISSLAGCSQEHFRRICWNELGTSPMKHLSSLRLSQARALLATTSLTIEEISGRLGYSDAHTLSHAFKRNVGICPREFRRLHSEDW